MRRLIISWDRLGSTCRRKYSELRGRITGQWWELCCSKRPQGRGYLPPPVQPGRPVPPVTATAAQGAMCSAATPAVGSDRQAFPHSGHLAATDHLVFSAG